jgi:hypothetical protein
MCTIKCWICFQSYSRQTFDFNIKNLTIDIFVFICFATIGLTSQWLIIFSIRVSSAILTISLDEIKGKMSKLPINVLYTVIMHEGKLNKLIFGKFLNTMKRYKTSRYRPKHSPFKFLILKSKVWREYDWKHIQHLMVHIFKKFKESHQLYKNSDTENYQSLWCQTYCGETDKNKNINCYGLDTYYH